MLFGYYAPTKGFIFALVLVFLFNIICGMRSDGISIVNCKKFSFKKFKNALYEILLHLCIIEIVYTLMVQCGDTDSAIFVIKSMTYIFSYVYLQNSFKNLINAYPKIVSLRIIYHLIRFEFKRAMPSHVQEIVNRIEKEVSENGR